MKLIQIIRRKIRNRKAAMISGAVIGLAAGVLVTTVSAWNVISKERNEFLNNIEKLTEQKDALEDELTRANAVWNNADALAQDADTDDWRLVLVNEEHPLDAAVVKHRLVLDMQLQPPQICFGAMWNCKNQ